MYVFIFLYKNNLSLKLLALLKAYEFKPITIINLKRLTSILVYILLAYYYYVCLINK